MEYKPLDYCVNIIGFMKNERKYAMCCAWAMQADYDKLLALIGSQSETGKEIKVGDKLGFSVLNQEQKNIALQIGSNHSSNQDKFNDLDLYYQNNALLIKNACRNIVCEVIDVIKLNKEENDNLVYLKIVDYVENNNDFLHYGEM